MKMTHGTSPTPRIHRRVGKRQSSGKNRPVPGLSAIGTLQNLLEELQASVDPCDNSSDSGLGFDHHLDYQFNARRSLTYLEQENWYEEHPEVKRRRVDIKVESDDANDYCFPENIMRVKGPSDSARVVPESMLRMGGAVLREGLREGLRSNPAVVGRPLTRAANMAGSLPLPLGPLTSLTSLGRRAAGAGGVHHGGLAAGAGGVVPSLLPGGVATLTTQLGNTSRDGRVQLLMVYQPETQHRARYQTEGSRGAVKDRSGNGFPVVKLSGYNKAATLQVFIGTDQGRVAPHMFYQACRVCGKNSTPCVEKKVDGTVVIEVDFEPSKEMTVTCDCVGILKERNVDVEHRFPDQTTSRSKKKSTRCRMVFRATIVNDDGTQEVLQVTSQPIVCTQPPGVPEICKKSLTTAPCTGGMELFIIGKNFLKDTRVIFQKEDEDFCWKEVVTPDKEYLQQTHLVCTVPAFRCPSGNLTEPVSVRLLVESGGKASEAHTFLYTSATMPATPAMQVGSPDVSKCCPSSSETGIPPVLELNRSYSGSSLLVPGNVPAPVAVAGPGSSLMMPFAPVSGTSPVKEDVHSSMLWPSGQVLKEEKAKELMPPPTSMAPTRRPSLIMPDTLPALKTEVMDEPIMTSMANPVMPSNVLPSNMPHPPAPSAEHLHGVDLRMNSLKTPSMATIQQFMRPSEANGCLPTQSGQSVETFLNRLECDKLALEQQRQQLQQQQSPPQQSPQQQEQSPQQRSPLDTHKSPELQPSHQEQGMAMSLQVQSMMESPQAEPFMNPPPAPGPIGSQMDNMLLYPPPVTTQDIYVGRPSAPLSTTSYLPPNCNTSPIAQKSILNSESPPQFTAALHDDNSNHTTELKPTPHQHFAGLSNPQMNHMMHSEQANRSQQMGHLMHDETSNHAQIAQILHDEASKEATQLNQVMHDERSNHAVDVKVSAAQQMACFLQDERSNHALEVKTTAAQHLAEILHDNQSNHAMDVQTSTAQQFAHLLQNDHSNHTSDVKTSCQSFGQIMHDESSNHTMDGKPPSSQNIAQMMANDGRNNATQQLAQMLQDEVSNHAGDVKTSTAQQLAQILHNEASNAALMVQEEQHNKGPSHLSFSHFLQRQHSPMEMNAGQQGFVPLQQGNPSQSAEMKTYCNNGSAAPLLNISNTQVTSLLPNDSSLVITQAPSSEGMQVNCITTSSSYNKPVYSEGGADMQVTQAQVQAVQAAQVQAQVQAVQAAQVQAQVQAVQAAQVQAQVQAQAQAQMQAQIQAEVQAQAEAHAQVQMHAQAQVQMQVDSQVQGQTDPHSQTQSSSHQIGFVAVTTSAGMLDFPILTKTLASGKIYATEVQQQQQQQQQSVQQNPTTTKPSGNFPEYFDMFQNQ